MRNSGWVGVLLSASLALPPVRAAADDRMAPAATTSPASEPEDVVVEPAPPPVQAPDAKPLRAPHSVFVHIDSSRPVDLGRKGNADDDTFQSVCTSPCDTYVPEVGDYRIIAPTEDGPAFASTEVRPSRQFAFRADHPRETLQVTVASQSGFRGGALILAVGGGLPPVGADAVPGEERYRDARRLPRAAYLPLLRISF
jgi:hypothetical protein